MLLFAAITGVFYTKIKIVSAFPFMFFQTNITFFLPQTYHYWAGYEKNKAKAFGATEFKLVPYPLYSALCAIQHIEKSKGVNK